TLKDLGYLNANEIFMNMLVKISLLIEIFVLGIVIVKGLLAEQKLLEKINLDQNILKNAKKIHHDIQSPLSVLEFISDEIKPKLERDENQLITQALSRIDNII